LVKISFRCVTRQCLIVHTGSQFKHEASNEICVPISLTVDKTTPTTTVSPQATSCNRSRIVRATVSSPFHYLFYFLLATPILTSIRRTSSTGPDAHVSFESREHGALPSPRLYKSSTFSGSSDLDMSAPTSETHSEASTARLPPRPIRTSLTDPTDLLDKTQSPPSAGPGE
jgi:hypothetical protein